MNLPLRLAPDGALLDARGEPVDPARVVAIVNAAWLLAAAEGGSVFRWRAVYAELLEAVRGETAPQRPLTATETHDAPVSAIGAPEPAQGLSGAPV